MQTQDLLNNVLAEMSDTLSADQMRQLSNVLADQLHNKTIVDESTDLVVGALSQNEIKLRMFAASKLAVNRARSTVKQYVYGIREALNIIGKDIEDITSMDVRWYCTILSHDHHLKPATIQTRLCYLSSFFEFLMSEDIVSKNPAKAIGPVKIEKVIRNPFSAEEMEKMRLACSDKRDRAIIEFLYSTGVRVSEVVALNVGDVDLDRQELVVWGKGSKERRTYLTDTAKFYLKRYLQTRQDEPNLEESPLFETKNHPYRRLTVAGIQYMLRELGQKAGVDDVYPHRFRRTIATNLLGRGMPIEEVKTFLGHEQIETTMIYCQIQQVNVQYSHHRYA